MYNRNKSTAGTGTSSRTVTYIGADGEKQTGTIPGVEGSGTAKEWYAALLDQTKKDNAATADAAAVQAGVDAENQVNALRSEYAAVNKELYRDYMEDKKNLPEALANQGYTGGMTESGLLKLENAYGEGLHENERKRLQQESEIRAQESQQIQTARAKAQEADSEAWQKYYTQMAELTQKEYEKSLDEARERAETLAKNGDITGYLRLGYTRDEAGYLINLWLAENPEYASVWSAYFG